MGRVCMTCFESYGSEITSLKSYKDEEGIHYVCPKRGCRGNIVEIDDILVPTIILLNEKGYYTESCCSGHVEEMFTTAYIIFSDAVENLPSIPPGYTLTAAITTDGDKRMTLSKPISGDSTIQVFQNILTTALQTFAWALSLPYAAYEEDEEYFEDKDFYEKESIDSEKMRKDIKSPIMSIGEYMSLLNKHSKK